MSVKNGICTHLISRRDLDGHRDHQQLDGRNEAELRRRVEQAIVARCTLSAADPVAVDGVHVGLSRDGERKQQQAHEGQDAHGAPAQRALPA